MWWQIPNGAECRCSGFFVCFIGWRTTSCYCEPCYYEWSKHIIYVTGTLAIMRLQFWGLRPFRGRIPQDTSTTTHCLPHTCVFFYVTDFSSQQALQVCVVLVTWGRKPAAVSGTFWGCSGGTPAFISYLWAQVEIIYKEEHWFSLRGILEQLQNHSLEKWTDWSLRESRFSKIMLQRPDFDSIWVLCAWHAPSLSLPLLPSPSLHYGLSNELKEKRV